MKKPFLLIKNPKDMLKICFCIFLSAAAVSLFFLPGEAVTVFAGEGADMPKSLFGLLSRLV